MAGRDTANNIIIDNVVDMICVVCGPSHCHSMERFAGQDGLTISERMGGMMEFKFLGTAIIRELGRFRLKL